MLLILAKAFFFILLIDEAHLFISFLSTRETCRNTHTLRNGMYQYMSGWKLDLCFLYLLWLMISEANGNIQHPERLFLLA